MSRARIAIAALALGISAACGGDAADEAPPPASPAANIDREADGRITGPINRARDVADDANARQEQLERDSSMDP